MLDSDYSEDEAQSNAFVSFDGPSNNKFKKKKPKGNETRNLNYQTNYGKSTLEKNNGSPYHLGGISNFGKTSQGLGS